MLRKLRPRLTYANVVSTLCLFILLGGGAYAATTINGSTLTNRSVTGKKLKKNTLTGTEIKESKLGTVPHAASATNASKLAGRPASAYAATGCPAGTVRVGPTCIDRYEASVWSKPNGGTQYGVSSADYPCNANGNDCKGKIFARSVAGVRPSAYVTWFQAEQALANSGKRLPTNAEWQQAAAGTQDPGNSPGSQDCNTNSTGPVATGSRANCVSAWGLNDMVGNLYEWVADWGDQASGCTNWPSGFGSDASCVGLGEGETNSHLPGALVRGDDFGDGADAGLFAVNALNQPSDSHSFIGFRGAR